MKTKTKENPSWPKAVQAIGSTFIAGYSIVNLFNYAAGSSDHGILAVAAWAVAAASFSYLAVTGANDSVKQLRENRARGTANRKSLAKLDPV